MDTYHQIVKFSFILWPLFVAIQAWCYRLKQNGDNPFTGGPISWPKAFWLSYTILTWFILPLIIIFYPTLSTALRIILIIHLVSWWTRGLLELIMIYKWFNWSPRYGISHDLFHTIVIGFLFYYFRFELISTVFGSISFLAVIYILMLFISTSAEILFAFMFLKFRTEIEARNNIYFASDEAKWNKINKITLVVVCIVYAHLIFQSTYAAYFF
jgi:hypothetical protein